LEERFAHIFPHIASIILKPEMGYRVVENLHGIMRLEKVKAKGEALYFKLTTGGGPVPASQIADGVLLVLAYLAVLYLPETPRVLLVEEPENGVHPKLLHSVLGILRELVREPSYTQVMLTTHSPYALDLFKPEEVTLCTMQDSGEVKTTRLADSPTVMNQTDVFTLGEIWTAEGDDAIAQARETTGEGAQ
jgi:predicted ATPase